MFRLSSLLVLFAVCLTFTGCNNPELYTWTYYDEPTASSPNEPVDFVLGYIIDGGDRSVLKSGTWVETTFAETPVPVTDKDVVTGFYVTAFEDEVVCDDGDLDGSGNAAVKIDASPDPEGPRLECIDIDEYWTRKGDYESGSSARPLDGGRVTPVPIGDGE